MASHFLGCPSFSFSSTLLNKVESKYHGIKSVVSMQDPKSRFQALQLKRKSLGLQVICAVKPETVEKVCEIVKRQLALPDGSVVTPESKFSALGADSLDTVEIVMGLEEEFGISVGEENAQDIVTVQDAAELIEDLVAKKTV